MDRGGGLILAPPIYLSPEASKILVLNMIFEAYILKIFWDVHLFCSSKFDDFRNDKGYQLKIRMHARRFSKDGAPTLYFHIESQTSNYFTKWNKSTVFLVLLLRQIHWDHASDFFFVRKLNGWLRLLHFMLLLEVQNIILTVRQLHCKYFECQI